MNLKYCISEINMTTYFFSSTCKGHKPDSHWMRALDADENSCTSGFSCGLSSSSLKLLLGSWDMILCHRLSLEAYTDIWIFLWSLDFLHMLNTLSSKNKKKQMIWILSFILTKSFLYLGRQSLICCCCLSIS